jgi:predicted ester cyclase
LHAADGVYEEIGTGGRFEGIEEILAALHAWKAAIPDAAGEVVRIFSANDVVIAEIVWRGTHTGPLTSRNGTLPATGRTFEMSGALFQQWSGGQVVHQRQHLDVLAMLTQLGALPGSA